jgi:hypothetical protein
MAIRSTYRMPFNPCGPIRLECLQLMLRNDLSTSITSSSIGMRRPYCGGPQVRKA